MNQPEPTTLTASSAPEPAPAPRSPVMAGFVWHRADTLAALGLAAAVLLAYYPMAIEGKIPLDRDTLTFFYPFLSLFHGSDSLLWNPWQQGGCSFAANPQAALAYPPNWFLFFVPLPAGYIVSTLAHYYLAALGMYLLARFSRLPVLPALVAAFTFSLGGYMASRLLLRPLMLSAAWFPYVFLCYLYAHYRNVLLGYLFAAVFLALQVLAGMPHNAVYSAIALGAFALYKAFIEFLHLRRFRVSLLYLARYAGFITVALLLSSIILLPTLELLPHTVRTAFDYEAATSGSLPLKWLPDIFTGGSFHQTRPVGWEFNETNCYLGVIAIWLALFGLTEHWRKGLFWFYSALVVISLVFALGSNTPVFKLFYHFPYLKSLGVPALGRMFDIPSRFLGMTAFALAMLAAYGMDSLAKASIRSPEGNLPGRGKLFIVLLAAGCLIWGILLGHLALVHGKAVFKLVMEPASREGLARFYAFANFGLFTLAFGSFTILFLLGKFRTRLFQLLLIFCLVADLVHNSSQVDVEFERPGAFYRPPVAVRYLRERADPTLRTVGIDVLKTQGADIFYTRLLPILTPKFGLFYRIQDVSGYDPLILKRYSELVQRMVGIAPGETPLRVVAWAHADTPLLDLMRVGYVSGEACEKPVFRGSMELRQGERRILRLDLERPCDEIRFRSVTTQGFDVRDNTQIGELLLRDATGETLLFPIRVGSGLETADLFAEVRHRHHPAPAFRTWSQTILGRKYRVHNYVCRLVFPRPFQPVEMEFRNDFDLKLAILGVALKQADTGRFTLAYESRMDRIYKNNTALPRAWWVHEALVQPSEQALLDIMAQNYLPDGTPIDYRKLALIERDPLYPLEASALPEGGSVEYVRWDPGHIVLDVESDAPGLLVLSEMKYPGWRAWIYREGEANSKGQDAEILAANYILRGVSLPAGRWRVEMVYRPRSFMYGLAASSLAIVLVALLFLRYRRRFPMKEY